MPDISTCLWYDGQAEEAAALYCSLLPNSHVTQIDRPAPDAPAVLVYFTLNGVPYVALNGGPGYPHSIAASIVARMDSQTEADALYDRLLEVGGTESMCGWITDPFGVSWQVIPPGLPDALFGQDPSANERAFAEMRTQRKLNTAAIVAARETT